METIAVSEFGNEITTTEGVLMCSDPWVVGTDYAWRNSAISNLKVEAVEPFSFHGITVTAFLTVNKTSYIYADIETARADFEKILAASGAVRLSGLVF